MSSRVRTWRPEWCGLLQRLHDKPSNDRPYRARDVLMERDLASSHHDAPELVAHCVGHNARPEAPTSWTWRAAARRPTPLGGMPAPCRRGRPVGGWPHPIKTQRRRRGRQSYCRRHVVIICHHEVVSVYRARCSCRVRLRRIRRTLSTLLRPRLPAHVRTNARQKTRPTSPRPDVKR